MLPIDPPSRKCQTTLSKEQAFDSAVKTPLGGLSRQTRALSVTPDPLILI